MGCLGGGGGGGGTSYTLPSGGGGGGGVSSGDWLSLGRGGGSKEETSRGGKGGQGLELLDAPALLLLAGRSADLLDGGRCSGWRKPMPSILFPPVAASGSPSHCPSVLSTSAFEGKQKTCYIYFAFPLQIEMKMQKIKPGSSPS